MVKEVNVKNPINSFVEYLSVREQRYRLANRLTMIAVAYGAVFIIAVIAYVMVR